MTRLTWESAGDRRFEVGIDRGVIYIPEGRAVVWNGLTSVEERLDEKSEPYYLDGVKYLDREVLGDFYGTIKAFTYPDELELLAGMGEIGEGLFIRDQKPNLFHLSYRTRIGNDFSGEDFGYKIHILYNVFAVPETVVYQTLSDDFSSSDFSWDIVATPVSVSGYRPTAHVIIDSTRMDPEVLVEIEDILYGTVDEDPHLPPLEDLITLVRNSMMIVIEDHGDGTWSATGPSRYFTMLDETTFGITGVDAVYLDESTYEVQTTLPSE